MSSPRRGPDNTVSSAANRVKAAALEDASEAIAHASASRKAGGAAASKGSALETQVARDVRVASVAASPSAGPQSAHGALRGMSSPLDAAAAFAGRQAQEVVARVGQSALPLMNARASIEFPLVEVVLAALALVVLILANHILAMRSRRNESR